MNAATSNAKRLQEDAQALLDAGRAPTAASLAALSIEESGKVSILRQLATATTPEEVAVAWKSYRSHTRKNVQWLLPELAVKGARKLEDFRSLFEEGAEHPVVLDHVKQLGFYTDCLGNCHWSTPIEVVDAQLAKSLVQIANLFVSEREITVTEIELWVTHVGSASKGDLAGMKQALVAWYAAMQEAGLYQSGVNEMERFIYEGVPMPEVSQSREHAPASLVMPRISNISPK
ncbi:MAG: AbiV family abortive infection protein [Rhodoferax sp.]|nr:AbiV family abortive infection protein [Rhodoferax sp.]